jgi:hypothetical protein
MIKNKKILTKINEKTESDPILKKFLIEICNNDDVNKHYKNKYNELINKSTKKIRNK